MRHQLIIAAMLVMPAAMVAQDRERAHDPQAAGELRVEEYREALGLNDEQAAQMTRIFVQAEKDAMPLREKCADIQEKLQGQMEESTVSAERVLDKRQQVRLAELRKSGKFVSTASSCGSEKAAKGGACCAGKAKAEHAAPAERTRTEKAAPTPNSTTAPSPARGR